MKKSWSSLFVSLALGVASVCSAASTLFPVVVGGRWGFTDKSGATVINPQFDHAQVFAEGLAPVRTGRWGYVNESGSIVINPQFDDAGVFSEGLAAVRPLGGGPGIGTPYYDPRPYDPFHVGGGGGGGGRYGYINSEGKYVINPQFDNAKGVLRRIGGGENGPLGFC